MTNLTPRHIFLLFLWLGILSALSCKSTKRGTAKPLKARSAAWLTKKIDQHRIDAEWLDAKAKLDFDSDDFRISASANIRFKKDSAIWMTGKKFGIEGVRVLITPDSVYIIDRLNKEYRIEGMDYIQQQFNLPVTFYDLQDILLGNAILLPGADRLLSAVDSTHYLLSEKQPTTIEKSYRFDGREFFPVAMDFAQANPHRTARITMTDHRPAEGTDLFSYFRALTFQSPETGNIALDLKFSKVTLNVPKSLKFEIPGHYTRTLGD